jgi:hypothetical protein
LTGSLDEAVRGIVAVVVPPAPGADVAAELRNAAIEARAATRQFATTNV